MPQPHFSQATQPKTYASELLQSQQLMYSTSVQQTIQVASSGAK